MKPVYKRAHKLAFIGACKLTPELLAFHHGPIAELVRDIKAAREPLGEWRRLRDAVLVMEGLMEAGVWKAPKHERVALVTGWMETIEAVVSRRRASPGAALHAHEVRQLDSIVQWHDALLREASQRVWMAARCKAYRRCAQWVAEARKQALAAGLAAPVCDVGPDLLAIADLA